MEAEMDGKLVERLRRWCALQDRSEGEFKRKAMGLGLTADQTQSLLPPLRAQGFLDDTRFAETYVRAHMRDKLWGPVKLLAGLRERGVAEAISERVVGEVAERIWQEKATELLARRPAPESEADRARLIRWLAGKGYRMDHILKALDDGRPLRTFAEHDHD
jgi:regulatory protein